MHVRQCMHHRREINCQSGREDISKIRSFELVLARLGVLKNNKKLFLSAKRTSLYVADFNAFLDLHPRFKSVPDVHCGDSARPLRNERRKRSPAKFSHSKASRLLLLQFLSVCVCFFE